MEQLRLKIIEECNKSELPLEAVVFVIRDVYRDVLETFTQYQQQIQKEQPLQEETNE